MVARETKPEELVNQLAAEIRILEESISTLQSRLEIVRSAIGEVTNAQAALEGLSKMQEGEETLVPTGAGSYVRMKLADPKKLVMVLGSGTAMEKDFPSSVGDMKTRLFDLDKARTSIQQQLEQTLARYDQDRDALNQLIRAARGGTTAS